MKFELDEDQTKQVNKWMTELFKDRAYIGAIGGRFTFSFTGTGLGNIIVVTDNVTGKKLDLTDYDSW